MSLPQIEVLTHWSHTSSTVANQQLCPRLRLCTVLYSARQASAQHSRQIQQRTIQRFILPRRSSSISDHIAHIYLRHHASRNLEILHRAGYFPQPGPFPPQSQHRTLTCSTTNLSGRCQTTAAILYLRSFSPTSPSQRPRFRKALLELHLLDRLCAAGSFRKGQWMQGSG